MSRKHNKALTDHAKMLRKNMTRHEKHLWYDFLKTYPLRVLRQKIIDVYITDFYCAAAKIVIERDGSQHFFEQGLDYDKKRSTVFGEYGISVLRFTNLEIDQNFEGVCEQIDREIQKKSGSGGEYKRQ